MKNEHPECYLDLLRFVPNIDGGRDLLKRMGEEYLSDRNNLSEIDQLIDELRDVIKSPTGGKIHPKDIQKICTGLQDKLSEIYPHTEANSVIDERSLDSRLTEIKHSIIELLGSVDTSTFEVPRPATGSRDPEILPNAQQNCTVIERSGSREQVAGSREMPLVTPEEKCVAMKSKLILLKPPKPEQDEKYNQTPST